MSIPFGNEISLIFYSSLIILLNNLFYNPVIALIAIVSPSGLVHSSSHGSRRICFLSSPCQKSKGKHGGHQRWLVTPLQLSPFAYRLLPFKFLLAPGKPAYRLLLFKFLLAPKKHSPHSSCHGYHPHLTSRGICNVWVYLPGNPQTPP
jgi:hypothetical protein